MKFSIEKKSDDLEDELEDEEEVEVETKTVSLDRAAKRRMLRFMGIILLGMILLLVILYIASLITNRTRSYTYEEVETVLKEAAVSYFKDNPSSLPVNEGGIVEIDSSNLVAAGKMNDLSSYMKNGEICSGTVQVQKMSNDYLYRPFLNCGENYTTVEFYKKVLNDNAIVSTGYGLYSNNGTYSFRGELVNNYVQFDSSLWRVVKINPNNTMVLVLNDRVGYTMSWDDRYNESKEYDTGINQYSASRMKEYLDKVWKTSDPENDEEYLLSENDKSLLTTFDLCVGKRNAASEAKDNSVECQETLQNQKIGLLTLSDFMNASVDPNCKNSTTISCVNYNYLVNSYYWWLATAYSDNSYQVFQVSGSNGVSLANASNNASVRPTVVLKSNALYKSGSGTEEDPYTLR